ncbi:MAG: hypothetical protein M0031_10070 [Thermaerobacter sp.]|nr:hypothetical protein [Thermaerobacter sp.]
MTSLAVAIFRFAEGRGYFEPLRQLFQPAVKTVAHTPQDKLLTLILSLMVGCPYTSGINRDLRPYPALAQLLGRPSLPDQSQVSRLLRGMTPWDLEDLLLVFEETLRRQSRSCSSSRPFTLDVDTSGLVADGRTYENTAKGYFPGARGKRGYQLDTAYVPDYAETLAVFLDRGNVPPGKRFLDVMCAVAEVLDGWERIGLVRGDCAQGTVEHMRFLLEHRLAFLLREKAWKAARRIGGPWSPSGCGIRWIRCLRPRKARGCTSLWTTAAGLASAGCCPVVLGSRGGRTGAFAPRCPSREHGGFTPARWWNCTTKGLAVSRST